jgi:hypothetical protein
MQAARGRGIVKGRSRNLDSWKTSVSATSQQASDALGASGDAAGATGGSAEAASDESTLPAPESPSEASTPPAAAAPPEAEQAASEAAVDKEEELIDIDSELDDTPTLAQELVATQQVRGVPVPYPKPKWLQWSLAGFGTLMLTTLAWSIYKVAYRSQTKTAKKRRNIRRNRDAIESIERILANNGRHKLTKTAALAIRLRTGFSPREVFRKHLRYILNEKEFDNNTSEDIVAVKAAFGVSTPSVRAEMAEAARRIAKRVGTLIVSPEGMTSKGLQRKAVGKLLFAKMLHLCEMKELAGSEEDSHEMVGILMREFGARDRDVRDLRGYWKHADTSLDASILGEGDDHEEEDGTDTQAEAESETEDFNREEPNVNDVEGETIDGTLEEQSHGEGHEQKEEDVASYEEESLEYDSVATDDSREATGEKPESAEASDSQPKSGGFFSDVST